MMRRINKELERLANDPLPGISCWLKADKLDLLQAQIVGDENTPYAKGIFNLELQVPERYPMEPPKVKFVTPIYHPNIDNAGRICLDLLKMPPTGQWKPTLGIRNVLMTIKMLMSEPNPDDPLMADISAEFQTDRALYTQKAEQLTLKHAMQNNMSLTNASTTSDNRKSDSSSDSSSESESSVDDTSLPIATHKRALCSDDMETNAKFKKIRASDA